MFVEGSSVFMMFVHLPCSEGDKESWDFGEGAGFYLNATQPKWKQYRMYDYVVKDLPSVLKQFKQLDLSKVGALILRPCLYFSRCASNIVTLGRPRTLLMTHHVMKAARFLSALCGDVKMVLPCPHDSASKAVAMHRLP